MLRVVAGALAVGAVSGLALAALLAVSLPHQNGRDRPTVVHARLAAADRAFGR